MRIGVLALSAAMLCLAGTDPRSAAEDYPVHGTVSQGKLAADFYGRAYDGSGGSFFAQDYLVVEVALFPKKGPNLKLAPGDFRLRLNGASREWSAVTAGQVAAAIRNPSIDGGRPGLVMGGGVGPGVVVMGGPRSVERFPGDPQARGPNRPGTGQQEGPTDAEKNAEAALKLALDPVEVDASGASGLIYFYWRGKLKDLKKVELVYDGPAGKTVFKLR